MSVYPVTLEEIEAVEERFSARDKAVARVFHEFDEKPLVQNLIRQLNDGLISSVEFARRVSLALC